MINYPERYVSPGTTFRVVIASSLLLCKRAKPYCPALICRQVRRQFKADEIKILTVLSTNSLFFSLMQIYKILFFLKEEKQGESAFHKHLSIG